MEGAPAGHGSDNGRRGPHGVVLVLNRLYQAIQVTGIRRAFRLFYAGRARAVDRDFRTYAFDHWCALPLAADGDVIRTPSRVIRIPRVIQLVRYDRVPRHEIRFSRRNVFLRDRNRCQYCGRVRPQRELNLDHVVPLSRGGHSTWENVVTACIECNSRKGNRTPGEAGMQLVRTPRRPRLRAAGGATWLGHVYEEWHTFLEASGWRVEVTEEIGPASGASGSETGH